MGEWGWAEENRAGVGQGSVARPGSWGRLHWGASLYTCTHTGLGRGGGIFPCVGQGAVEWWHSMHLQAIPANQRLGWGGGQPQSACEIGAQGCGKSAKFDLGLSYEAVS